jgi:SAM-dependent methyltransferase
VDLDHPGAYGDVFAAIYDSWYPDISDVDATVSTISALASAGRILELGVGTGRLAIPLVEAGCVVDGIDASPAMLELLVAKPGGRNVGSVCADMARLPVRGPYAVVFVAFNTFFNLTTAAAQEACVAEVARVLGPDGRLVIEAFIPSAEPGEVEHGAADRSDGAGGIVETTTVRDPTDQTVRGQHRHRSADGRVRTYPWAIRYLHVDQLDDLCARHGLQQESRWAGFDRADYDPDGDRHVSVYRRR